MSQLFASCRIAMPASQRDPIALMRVFNEITSGRQFWKTWELWRTSWKSCNATCHCPAAALVAIAALMHIMSAWSVTALMWKRRSRARSHKPSRSKDLIAALYAISFGPIATSMEDNMLKAAFHSFALLQDLIAAPNVPALIGTSFPFICSIRFRAYVHPVSPPALPIIALKWKVFTLTSLEERNSRIRTAAWDFVNQTQNIKTRSKECHKWEKWQEKHDLGCMHRCTSVSAPTRFIIGFYTRPGGGSRLCHVACSWSRATLFRRLVATCGFLLDTATAQHEQKRYNSYKIPWVRRWKRWWTKVPVD